MAGYPGLVWLAVLGSPYDSGIPYGSFLLLGVASTHCWVLCPHCYLSRALHKTSINVCNIVQLSHDTLMSTITPSVSLLIVIILNSNVHLYISISLSIHIVSSPHTQLALVIHSSHAYSVYTALYMHKTVIPSALCNLFSRYDSHHSPC